MATRRIPSGEQVIWWTGASSKCKALAAVCGRPGRREFMFSVAPLRFKDAAGKQVNPLAIL